MSIKSMTVFSLLILFSSYAFSQNCYFPTLQGMGDEIGCVGKGICEGTKTPGNPDGVKPSEKWLALIGIAAQEYYGKEKGKPFKTVNENEKKGLQKRVIEMIQAYGFCADSTGYAKITENSEAATTTKKVLAGRNKEELTDKSSGYVKEKFNSEFGFDAPFWGSKVSDFRDLFNHSEKWKDMSTTERQANYKEVLDDLTKKYEKLAKKEEEKAAEAKEKDKKDVRINKNIISLSKCLNQVKSLVNSHPKFALTKDKEFKANNEKFCRTMASSCSIKDDFCSHDRTKEQIQEVSETGPSAAQLKDAEFFNEGAESSSQKGTK